MFTVMIVLFLAWWRSYHHNTWSCDWWCERVIKVNVIQMFECLLLVFSDKITAFHKHIFWDVAKYQMSALNRMAYVLLECFHCSVLIEAKIYYFSQYLCIEMKIWELYQIQIPSFISYKVSAWISVSTANYFSTKYCL